MPSDVPEPKRGEARLRVDACGVCHSDSFTVEGQYPGLLFPRSPGHEIAGVIDAIGAGVVGWRQGQRVGVGWFGGHCGHCEPCRRGWLIDCRNLRIPGISYDGGYAEAMAAWFGREPKLRYLPWSEWKDAQAELEAAQTYDHIAHSPNCSIAKAENMLGFRPRYGSIEAVCESVSWLIERGIVKVERKAV